MRYMNAPIVFAFGSCQENFVFCSRFFFLTPDSGFARVQGSAKPRMAYAQTAANDPGGELERSQLRWIIRSLFLLKANCTDGTGS